MFKWGVLHLLISVDTEGRHFVVNMMYTQIIYTNDLQITILGFVEEKDVVILPIIRWPPDSPLFFMS